MPRLWKPLCIGLAVITLAFVSIFAASCGSSNTSYRVVDAIANYDYTSTGGFDININGSIVFSGMLFGNIQPSKNDNYQGASSGNNALEVFPHNADVNGTEQGSPVINSSLGFGSGTQYTVLLMGNNTTNPYVAQPFTDNNAVPTTGDFEFRVIDASNNLTKNVDIYIVGSVVVVTGPKPPAPSATLTFGQASGYISDASGTWWLVITNQHFHTPIVPPTSYAPSALQIRTIVLVDGPDGLGVGTPLVFNDLN